MSKEEAETTAEETLEAEIPDRGECFTFDDGEGDVTIFAICAMRIFVEKHGHKLTGVKKITQPIDPGHIAHVRKNMGIEQERLDRLVDPYLHQPLMGAVWEKRPHGFSLIDGNHRIVRLHELGEKTYEIWVWHWLMWRQFVVDPRCRPENWRERPSQMIEFEQGRME